MKLYKKLRQLTCGHKHKVRIATIPKGTTINNQYFKHNTELCRCLKCGKEFYKVKKEESYKVTEWQY